MAPVTLSIVQNTLSSVQGPMMMCGVRQCCAMAGLTAQRRPVQPSPRTSLAHRPVATAPGIIGSVVNVSGSLVETAVKLPAL